MCASTRRTPTAFALKCFIVETCNFLCPHARLVSELLRSNLASSYIAQEVCEVKVSMKCHKHLVCFVYMERTKSKFIFSRCRLSKLSHVDFSQNSDIHPFGTTLIHLLTHLQTDEVDAFYVPLSGLMDVHMEGVGKV